MRHLLGRPGVEEGGVGLAALGPPVWVGAGEGVGRAVLECDEVKGNLFLEGCTQALQAVSQDGHAPGCDLGQDPGGGHQDPLVDPADARVGV